MVRTSGHHTSDRGIAEVLGNEIYVAINTVRVIYGRLPNVETGLYTPCVVYGVARKLVIDRITMANNHVARIIHIGHGLHIKFKANWSGIIAWITWCGAELGCAWGIEIDIRIRAHWRTAESPDRRV